MKIKIEKEVSIAGEYAYLVMTTEISNIKFITVVHKNEFSNKLGGTRFVTKGSVEEAFYLAKGMSEKCLACSIPVDGLKTLIIAPRGIPSENDRARLLSKHISKCVEVESCLIFGPDMGSPESVMDRTFEYLGRKYSNITGLSQKFGGLDIDKNGFTAFGVDVAMESIFKNDGEKRVSLQGYGEVGSVLASLLYNRGYIIVAVSNINGVITDPEGIDIGYLYKLYKEDQEKCIENYGKDCHCKFHSDPDRLFDCETDVLIPAARTTVLCKSHEIESLKSENPNVKSIEKVIDKTGLKYIIEVANHPLTYSTETYAEQNGVIVIPDFIVNCGGMIGCYIEWKNRERFLTGQLNYEQAINNCKSAIRKTIKENLRFMFQNGNSNLREKGNMIINLNRKKL